MPSSTFSYTSADGTRIAAYRWDPAGEPRAAVQLTHGMGGHARRYDHGARHEIFNETNRDEVIAELTGWLDRVAAGAGPV